MDYEDIRYEVDGPVAVLTTGEGDRAFCVGGDVKQRNESGDYGPTDNGLFEGTYLQRLIRDVPKPVIAAVTGAAIGGGHVLHVLCALASPPSKPPSDRPAREIWFLLDQYSGADAERWGLVNRVVPKEELLTVAKQWGNKMAGYSPTALRFPKHSFNADTDHQGGLSQLSQAGLDVFVTTAEAQEGAAAFAQKSQPEFDKHYASQ